MEKGVKTTVSGENIEIIDSGKIIVNAVKLSSVIKNLPDGKAEISVDENFHMTVKCGRSEFELNGINGATFPLMPELKGEKSLKLPRKTLKSMIVSTLFSAANNSNRPALNGVLFEIKGKQLNLVSSDGNRLSIARNFEGVTSSDELDISFIIPAKSLSELIKLIGDGDETVNIELTVKHAIISFDNIIFFSRLIESEFLDYKRVTAINPKTSAAVNTRSFSDGAERAALVTDGKNPASVTLNFKKDEDSTGILQVASASAVGRVHDECDIEMSGDDIKIAFNQRYLAEALKAVKDEKVLIKLESPMKSLVILPCGKDTDISSADVDSGKFLYLVLPVRLKED
jgi:DNA polymerase-3 subunit beta